MPVKNRTKELFEKIDKTPTDPMSWKNDWDDTWDEDYDFERNYDESWEIKQMRKALFNAKKRILELESTVESLLSRVALVESTVVGRRAAIKAKKEKMENLVND